MYISLFDIYSIYIEYISNMEIIEMLHSRENQERSYGPAQVARYTVYYEWVVQATKLYERIYVDISYK